MKYKDLEKKSIKDLKKLDEELRLELFKLKIKKGANQLDAPHKLGLVKKDIARVQTKISELQRADS